MTNIYLGLDVGKTNHHATALTSNGKNLGQTPTPIRIKNSRATRKTQYSRNSATGCRPTQTGLIRGTTVISKRNKYATQSGNQ